MRFVLVAWRQLEILQEKQHDVLLCLATLLKRGYWTKGETLSHETSPSVVLPMP